MGHTEASYTEARFLAQQLGGLETTAGVTYSEACGVRDPQAPTVEATADRTEGEAGLLVHFSSVGVDPEGRPLRYRWDFGDGATSSDRTTAHNYRTPGTYEAKVTVTDREGKIGTDRILIKITNPVP